MRCSTATPAVAFMAALCIRVWRNAQARVRCDSELRRGGFLDHRRRPEGAVEAAAVGLHRQPPGLDAGRLRLLHPDLHRQGHRHGVLHSRSQGRGERRQPRHCPHPDDAAPGRLRLRLAGRPVRAPPDPYAGRAAVRRVRAPLRLRLEPAVAPGAADAVRLRYGGRVGHRGVADPGVHSGQEPGGGVRHLAGGLRLRVPARLAPEPFRGPDRLARHVLRGRRARAPGPLHPPQRAGEPGVRGRARTTADRPPEPTRAAGAAFASPRERRRSSCTRCWPSWRCSPCRW